MKSGVSAVGGGVDGQLTQQLPTISRWRPHGAMACSRPSGAGCFWLEHTGGARLAPSRQSARGLGEATLAHQRQQSTPVAGQHRQAVELGFDHRAAEGFFPRSTASAAHGPGRRPGACPALALASGHCPAHQARCWQCSRQAGVRFQLSYTKTAVPGRQRPGKRISAFRQIGVGLTNNTLLARLYHQVALGVDNRRNHAAVDATAQRAPALGGEIRIGKKYRSEGSGVSVPASWWVSTLCLGIPRWRAGGQAAHHHRQQTGAGLAA